MMVIVLGYLDVDPAAVEGLLPVLQKQMEATRAEDGCVRYSLAIENADTGRISISECWRDEDALKANPNVVLISGRRRIC